MLEAQRASQMLHAADKGSLGEEVAQQVLHPNEVRHGGTFTREQLARAGIASDADRNPDLIGPGTIGEVKNYETPYGAQVKTQIKVDAQIADKSLELTDKAGNKQKITRFRHTEMNPAGVKANARFLAELLAQHPNTTVEIINNKGEVKVLSAGDAGFLTGPELDPWLFKR